MKHETVADAINQECHTADCCSYLEEMRQRRESGFQRGVSADYVDVTTHIEILVNNDTQVTH